jgi:hypothetical protein
MINFNIQLNTTINERSSMNEHFEQKPDPLQDTVELDVEAIFKACDEAARASASQEPHSDQATQIQELTTPASNAEETKVRPVINGNGLSEVYERDESGVPTLWMSWGGSLWKRDSSGRALKVRDKWG